MASSPEPARDPIAERLRRPPLSWQGLRAARRALARWSASFLRDQLFGFTILDGIYFVTLYTFGSYFLLDAPLHASVHDEGTTCGRFLQAQGTT